VIIAALIIANDNDVFQIGDVVDWHQLHHEHLVLLALFAAGVVAFSRRWSDAA
jgi:hypothetical protein